MKQRRTYRDTIRLNYYTSLLDPLEELTPEQIYKIREGLGHRGHRITQLIFSRHLGVSKTTVSEWERGIKKPSRASLRLLQIINKYGLEICRKMPVN